MTHINQYEKNPSQYTKDDRLVFCEYSRVQMWIASEDVSRFKV